MNPKLRVVTVAALWFVLGTSSGLAQRSEHVTSPQPHTQAQPPVQPVRPVYQRRESWYEFLLKQFNPDNLDYGTWMEQRRQAFLEARVRNPYFGYSLGVTFALLLVTAVSAKLWIDHRRAMWVTAEMMADVYSHDLYSRQFAREAIQKYNDHIERCNRAIEAAEHGTLAGIGATTDIEELRADLHRVTADLASKSRENDKLQDELQKKAKLVAELSMRVEGVAKRGGDNGRGAQVVDAGKAESNLIVHINNLQEQLYAERQKNRQLKGA
jgi:hypothetical protein